MAYDERDLRLGLFDTDLDLRMGSNAAVAGTGFREPASSAGVD